MPLPEALLNEMKCCIFNDGHIAIEPIQLKCGALACKECIKSKTECEMNCYNCSGTHNKSNYINSTKNKLSETVIQFNLDELFQYVDETLKSVHSNLKKESLINELNSKIEGIENEMDVRVESLVNMIHDYRDECKHKLNKAKEEFQNSQHFRALFNDEDGCSKVLNKQEMMGNTLEDLKKMQNELKIYQEKLNNFRKNLNNIHFAPSKFEFSSKIFGDIKNHKFLLNDSLILNENEALTISEMSKSITGNLLYRATRDGFSAEAFHSKCDGVANTITIIKNNFNYVFGGYASEPWNSSGSYIYDRNAFLFSLRKYGISQKNDKFLVGSIGYALYGHSNYGPTFGAGHDLHICDHSNVTIGNHSNFGHSYILPAGLIYGRTARDRLAGNYNQWKTVEIEVYQIS